jgi:hypothetical protein
LQPITKSPPSEEDSSLISVPRPAILVETVTAPFLPADAIVSASFSSFAALSTLDFIPFALSFSESATDSQTLLVPIVKSHLA